MAADQRPRVVLVNRCFVRDEGKLFLILQRAQTDAMNAGKWEVPGGKLDEGQDLTHAQEREVMEETGLLVQPTHPLVFADSFVIGTGQYIGLPYVVLFSITRLGGGKLTLSEEHMNHEWVTYDEMLARTLTVEVRKAAIMLRAYLEAPAISHR